MLAQDLVFTLGFVELLELVVGCWVLDIMKHFLQAVNSKNYQRPMSIDDSLYSKNVAYLNFQLMSVGSH